MSVPTSPRVPSSPDLARRRVPRAKDKRRALRDFYGIQQSQNNGPIDYDPLIDGQDFSVSLYLSKLNDDCDIKKLLNLENQMIRDIRVLDGERKALVYDNYGKMIAATETIQKVTTEMQPMNRETFDPILKLITDLATDVDHFAQGSEGFGYEVQDNDNEDEISNMLLAWINDGPARVRELIKNNATEVALEEITDLERVLSTVSDEVRTMVEPQLKHLQQDLLMKHAHVAEQEPVDLA